MAIIDWYSRRVLGWRISNSLDTSFCVDCLEDALALHGKPEIFNSDQGSQFTSATFTGMLKGAGIAISMDGRGRALDNIFVERLWRSLKHEDVYLKECGTVAELIELPLCSVATDCSRTLRVFRSAYMAHLGGRAKSGSRSSFRSSALRSAEILEKNPIKGRPFGASRIKRIA